jgi:hypothetical protein
MAAYTNYRRDPRVRREAETLADRGYDVTFIARRQSGEPDTESVSGVRVIKLPGLANPKTSAALYMADYAIFFLLLTAYISLRPLRFDLIHINNMPDFLVFSTVVPRLMGKPVIHDVHDLMPELYMEKFGTDEKHWIALPHSIAGRRERYTEGAGGSRAKRVFEGVCVQNRGTLGLT